MVVNAGVVEWQTRRTQNPFTSILIRGFFLSQSPETLFVSAVLTLLQKPTVFLIINPDLNGSCHAPVILFHASFFDEIRLISMISEEQRA